MLFLVTFTIFDIKVLRRERRSVEGLYTFCTLYSVVRIYVYTVFRQQDKNRYTVTLFFSYFVKSKNVKKWRCCYRKSAKTDMGILKKLSRY